MMRRPALNDVLSRSPVLVTGGSSGIGLAIAAELAPRTRVVHLVARGRERLVEARDRLAHLAPGTRIEVHALDVGDARQVQELFDRLRSDPAGAPGVLVNCAGATAPGRFIDLGTDTLEQLMRSNWLGTVHMLKEAVPAMIARREGYILNVSSVAGLMGVYGMTGYSSAKFALRGLTQALRSEVRQEGVVVSLLCPPDTRTPMLEAEIPLRPAATEALSPSNDAVDPRFVAVRAVAGLARGRAEILPGSTAWIPALAQRWAPGLLEAYMDFVVRRAVKKSA